MTEQVTKKLQEVVSLIEKYEKQIDEDGSRFNIFSILNLSSSEVRLHSTFIAELLDRKGTHSFGNVFCKLFLDEISEIHQSQKINLDFNTENYSVEIEKYIGRVSEDYSSGGRIDIILCDNFNQKIIIENKIFAYDQENQLLRYYNYDKKALLLYLTLFGEDASGWSTSNLLHKDSDYHCISYKNFITNWLKKCLLVCHQKPKVKNTIEQYLNIIENYTEQSYKHRMSEEIINLLSNNKDFYNSIDEIINSYNILKNRIYSNFKKQIEQKKPNELICITQDRYEIKYLIDEDYEGFFYGFYIEKDGKIIKGNDSQIFPIANILKEINSQFQNNDTYVGWVFSKFFRKFWEQEKEKIFELNSDAKMNEFTNMLISELQNYIDELKNRLKNACR